MSRTSKSCASKIKNNSVESGVGNMATLDCFIYTYIYTDYPNTVYCFWELHHESHMKEIQRVLAYYHRKSIIESYVCGKVDIEESEWKEFMLLMDADSDGDGNIVRRHEYDCMLPILQTKIITQYHDCVADEHLDTILRDVTLFGKTWYVPFKEMTYMKNIPITITTDPNLLFNWWNQALDSKKISYDTICRRIQTLIKKIPNKRNFQEVMTEKKKEIVNSYINLYMKPSSNKESILLSEVYQDFLKQMKEHRPNTISQVSFIKELREQTEQLTTKINIVRHACGMVITNYTILNYKPPISDKEKLDSMYEVDNSHLKKSDSIVNPNFNVEAFNESDYPGEDYFTDAIYI